MSRRQRDRRGGEGANNGGQIAGISDFSIANYYQSPAATIGSAASFYVSCLIVPGNNAVLGDGTAQVLTPVSSTNETNQGFLLSLEVGNARMYLRDTVGGLTSTPIFSISASDVGKIMLITAYHDNVSKKLGITRNGTLVGEVSTSAVTWAPSTGVGLIGTRPSQQPFLSPTYLLGISAGSRVIGATEATAQAAAVKTAGGMVAVNPADHTWTFAGLPATVADKATSGQANLTRVGSGPAVTKSFSKVWGW